MTSNNGDLVCVRDFAISMAKTGSRIILEHLSEDLAIEFKGPLDLVTRADLASEDFLTSSIRERFPEHGILTEERKSWRCDAENLWIVDPLDGTTNFAHGYPFSCISLAYREMGELQVGVVYDIHRDECFSAIGGSGAQCNGEPIKVSGIKNLIEGLVATGFPYDRATSPVNNLDNFCRVMPRVIGIRRDGSSALDLCYVACGRYDAYWELKLKPWDMAAGELIAQEAGAKVTDERGGAFSLDKGNVVCTNGHIHDELLALLK